MHSNTIFNIKSKAQFEEIALLLFRHQAQYNKVYREFLGHLKKAPETVKNLQEIPFLPIEFFKSQKVVTNSQAIEATFTSSGTTGKLTSKHHIADLSLYKKSYTKAFEMFYGPIKDYTILALLPSYLEREGSSLIFMVRDLIETSRKPGSGFYLDNLPVLRETLTTLDAQGEQVLLIGVSFALLDLIELGQIQLKNTLVMETGGMKGRRKEIIRAALHKQLKTGFGLSTIHSEYGMTELLSQAYSKGSGIFKSPPWMDILIRDPEDPFSMVSTGKTGGINIIDLANINSCAFIATQDLGRRHSGGSFEVLGRFDNSDIRGCNLLIN